MSNCIQVTAVFVLVTPFYMQLEQLHIEAHTKVEIFTHELYNYLNSSTFFFLDPHLYHFGQLIMLHQRG